MSNEFFILSNSNICKTSRNSRSAMTLEFHKNLKCFSIHNGIEQEKFPLEAPQEQHEVIKLSFSTFLCVKSN